jgi:hypothetical protein
MRTHYKPYFEVLGSLPAEIHVDEILWDFARLYAQMHQRMQPDRSLHENALTMLALDTFESSGEACRQICNGKEVLRAIGKYFRDEHLVGGPIVTIRIRDKDEAFDEHRSPAGAEIRRRV